jgi:hypothetical protein
LWSWNNDKQSLLGFEEITKEHPFAKPVFDSCKGKSLESLSEMVLLTTKKIKKRKIRHLLIGNTDML